MRFATFVRAPFRAAAGGFPFPDAIRWGTPKGEFAGLSVSDRSCPLAWCSTLGTVFTGRSRAGQLGDYRKADGGISAQRRDGFQGHVAGALDGPFIILLVEQDRADQADDGVLVGEDADHPGPPLDLAVEALDRIVECSLVRCCGGNVI